MSEVLLREVQALRRDIENFNARYSAIAWDAAWITRAQDAEKALAELRSQPVSKQERPRHPLIVHAEASAIFGQYVGDEMARLDAKIAGGLSDTENQEWAQRNAALADAAACHEDGAFHLAGLSARIQQDDLFDQRGAA